MRVSKSISKNSNVNFRTQIIKVCYCNSSWFTVGFYLIIIKFYLHVFFSGTTNKWNVLIQAVKMNQHIPVSFTFSSHFIANFDFKSVYAPHTGYKVNYRYSFIVNQQHRRKLIINQSESIRYQYNSCGS